MVGSFFQNFFELVSKLRYYGMLLAFFSLITFIYVQFQTPKLRESTAKFQVMYCAMQLGQQKQIYSVSLTMSTKRSKYLLRFLTFFKSIMTGIVSSIISHDFLQTFIQTIRSPHYKAL